MDEIKTSLDLYLLRVLHTLLTEGSVTRAAAKLNQSQPAVSAALRRLRDITGDPLLVRSRSGMVPTEYGAALLDPVRNALREIDRIVPYRTEFDPLRSVRTFKIGSPDYLNVLFLPTVVRSFRRQAPGARLEWQSLNPVFDYERALETGQLDLAIGNWPEPPEGLHRSDLFADRMVCLMSDKHPGASEPLTLDAYLQSTHLAPTAYSTTHRDIVDQHLARERLKRQVFVSIPYFNLVPYALVDSDLIFTTTESFAQYYAGFLPLTIRDAPFGFPPMRYYQLWHERAGRSQEVRWLRDLVAQAISKLLTERSVSGSSRPSVRAANPENDR
jgi:DNA-binding transcriptional LysR family regulator